MNNLALKYRPKTFDEIVGQKAIKEILSYQVANNSFKNCYLFVGASGCGKTTTARILCSQINGQKIEIDAASNTGVDNVRAIIEDAKFKSINFDYKVYIIDEAHMLSIGAWNSLLKLLEEPPKHCVFILCTTEPNKVPQTILSRVQRFDFGRISDDLIRERLIHILAQEECSSYDGGAIDLIVKNCNGGMRTAISMLDKCLDYLDSERRLLKDSVYMALNITNEDVLSNLIYAIFKKDINTIFTIVDEVFLSGKDITMFVNELICFCLEEFKKEYFNNNVSNSSLVRLLDMFLYLKNDLKGSQFPKEILLSTIITEIGG